MKSDKNKTTKAEKKQPVGRPKKDIDLDILGNLASIGCTQEEIGGVMGISARTLQRNYAEIIEVNKIDKPNIIVILAWRYKKQIIDKLKKMNLKTLVVTPIPKLEIIKIK